jgi:hypothetical protein
VIERPPVASPRPASDRTVAVTRLHRPVVTAAGGGAPFSDRVRSSSRTPRVTNAEREEGPFPPEPPPSLDRPKAAAYVADHDQTRLSRT